MATINKLYTEFHKHRLGEHCYPSEFIIRTMLGKYPHLQISHDYTQKKVLDWACGDGRNMPLFHNLQMQIYGFEITQEICDSVTKRMENFGISTDIRVGRNNAVPFEDNFFDYIVASMSFYYLDDCHTHTHTHQDSFQQNVNELIRVMKQDAYAIVTLVHPDSFILKNSIIVENGIHQITSDPYNLRNGDFFRVFSSKEEIIQTFEKNFKNICIGKLSDDYFGEEIVAWLVVMQKQ